MCACTRESLFFALSLAIFSFLFFYARPYNTRELIMLARRAPVCVCKKYRAFPVEREREKTRRETNVAIKVLSLKCRNNSRLCACMYLCICIHVRIVGVVVQSCSGTRWRTSLNGKNSRLRRD